MLKHLTIRSGSSCSRARNQHEITPAPVWCGGLCVVEAVWCYAFMMQNNAEHWIQEAVKEASHATCMRSKCGSVIVRDGTIIGHGHNSPAGNDERQRRCSVDKTTYDRKVTDKTCCVHAEERAIMDALRTNPDRIIGSTLYFARLNEEGTLAPSGTPYCTLCSKLALDVGVALFVLSHADGPRAYPTDEYNMRSYEYKDE
jgi:deoxycytidylate deaminase